MEFNKVKTIETLTSIGKIVSFLSLVMTVVIKTRILLGLKNPSEDWRNKDKSDDTDNDSTNKDSKDYKETVNDSES